MITDWSLYPNFRQSEFDCRTTGKNDMQPEFMERLQALRIEYGLPMIVTSGYRDPSHPLEARKREPGQHSKGLAADIACGAANTHELVRLAFKHGFRGIGVSQKHGRPRFIHLDLRSGLPVVYSY